MTTVSGNNVGSVSVATVGDGKNNWLISDVAFTFMRPRTITFTAEGLKPNTRYYPFFDNIYVGEYCSTQNATQESTIRTDSLGNVVGNFYLPARTFLCGTHIFKLVDNVKVNGTGFTPDPIYGSAETTYEATGILKTKEPQSISAEEVISSVIIPPVVKNPTFDPAPVEECERWAFEYTVVSFEQKSFSIDTNSSTPPATPPKPITGEIEIVENSITYVSTTPLGGNRFKHSYSYRTLSDLSQTYTQEWVGPKVTNISTQLLNLSTFRPSGLADNSVVTITKQWTRLGATTCPLQVGLKTPKKPDPLAQSFTVDSAKYPRGMFTTSIDVFFKTVDQSTPVILELREMQNGVPSSKLLPNSRVVLPGYAATQSSDATAATKFRFDNPIFLQSGRDYCFVLKSTSLGYNVWCSRERELDITINRIIDEQPFDGVLFKSINDTTWTPEPLEDIKFILNQAVFNTAQEVSLIFKPKTKGVGADSQYYATRQILPLSYISTAENSTKITIKIPNHGIKQNGASKKIFIDEIQNTTTSYNGVLASRFLGEHTVTVINEDFVELTLTGAAATNNGPLPVTGIFNIVDNEPPVYATPIIITPAEKIINNDTNSLTTTTTAVRSLTAPTTLSNVSPFTFSVYTNVPISEFTPDYVSSQFSNTTIKETVTLFKTGSLNESPFNAQIDNKNAFYELNDEHFLFAKKNQSANNNVQLKLDIGTNDKNLSPYIDVSNVSLIARSYNIDNQNGEITTLLNNPSKTLADFNDPIQNSEIRPGRGNANAKYKTTINLVGERTNQITIFITANCPEPAEIDVYIRVSNDRETHEDLNWNWVPINGIFRSEFKKSPNKQVLNEWMWIYNSDKRFSVFDLKFVMRSTNTASVPKIFGIRTITDISE